jgi:hypothetical protein
VITSSLHGDHVVAPEVARRGHAELLLDALGLVERRPQPHGDVVGDVVAPEPQHRRVLDRAVGEDGEVGGAAADVDETHAEVALIVGQRGLRRGEGLEHDVDDVEAGLVGALHDVLCTRHGRGDDVDLGFEADAAHAEGLPHAVLIVDDELLRDHVDHLAVHRDRHGLGGVDHPAHVALAHLPVLDRDDAVGVEAANVAAGDPGEDRGDLAVGHQLGFLDRVFDRRDRGVDVHDHALAQAP